MKKNCPYCNEEMIYKSKYDKYHYCNNHNNIKVEIDNSGIYIINAEYNCFILINDKEMSIWDGKEHIHFPIDKALTPENFEDKLKFYLMFQ